MKKIRFWSMIALLAMVFLGYSCSDDDEYVVKNVKVILSYPDGFDAKEGVNVKARGTSGTEFEAKTDKTGSVVFGLPLGSYEFTASDIRAKDKKFSALNGILTQMIGNEWKETSSLTLEMAGSTRSQLILKEVYFGGCPRDDSNRAYVYDAYVTLYNNSSEPVDLQNLCFGAMISNSYVMKRMKEVNEGETEPYWFKEDWTPAAIGYFYFPNKTVLSPYSQLVVAAYGAIDHTQVHSQSVDLSSAENYVMYDVDKFSHKYYYPAPSANISTTQYLKAAKFGMGTAWSTTISCPNLFLFYPEGQTPEAYGNDKTDNDFWMKNERFPRKKVPASWTVDGIDAFASSYETENIKRINPKVDAGHINFINGKGYTLYRNVDKDLTESIEGNKEKLVYNYSMGTKEIEVKYGSTDPSGIDAEASIANGAVIIYKDTNNSGNDFHMRKKSSLRK